MAMARSEIAAMRPQLLTDAQTIIGAATSVRASELDTASSTSDEDNYLIDETGSLVTSPSETSIAEDSSETSEEEPE